MLLLASFFFNELLLFSFHFVILQFLLACFAGKWLTG